jgi:hypothetical protein
MAKHTPGPWRVAFGNRLEIRGPKDEIGWPVPVVYNAGLHTDETAQANARLIADAPAMLEALEQCAQALDAAFDFEGDTFGLEHNSALDALLTARALIAKHMEPNQ